MGGDNVGLATYHPPRRGRIAGIGDPMRGVIANAENRFRWRIIPPNSYSTIRPFVSDRKRASLGVLSSSWTSNEYGVRPFLAPVEGIYKAKHCSDPIRKVGTHISAFYSIGGALP
jgi:hypothetical protein